MTNTADSFDLVPVVRALTMNSIITAVKAAGGFFLGSSALLAEAAHSFVNSFTEILILIGEKRGRKKLNAQYFWALLAAVNIFIVGGLFAAWEGVKSILDPETVDSFLYLAFIVLIISFLLDGYSWLSAYRSLAKTRNNTPWLKHIKETTDTGVKTVFYEDSADLLGCVLAFLGILLTIVTGSSVYDGIASVAIALLLTLMSYELGNQNLTLLNRS